MAKAFFTFKDKNSSEPQILNLGFYYEKKTLMFPIGVKLIPEYFDIKAKAILSKKSIDVMGFSRMKHLPFVNTVLDRNFNTNVFNTYVKKLETAINDFISENKENFSLELLKGFLNELFNPEKSEIDLFSDEVSNYIKQVILTAKKGKGTLTKEALIEKIDLFLHPIVEVPKLKLLDYVQAFIAESKNGTRLTTKGQKINSSTIQVYSATYKLLERYSQHKKATLYFDSIDANFYKAFNSYMVIDEKFSPNTLGKYIKTLKTFLHEATEQKLNDSTDFKSKNFKTIQIKTHFIALTQLELEQIANLDLSKNNSLDKVRDLFLIGCYTGQRFSDYINLKPENIKRTPNGYTLNIIQQKTDEAVVIPIDKALLTILSKYSNQLPKPISNQKFNDALKKVMELVPALEQMETFTSTKAGELSQHTVKRSALVTTHTARRTMATLAYEKGIDTELIMAITGHKKLETFKAYIKTNKDKKAQMYREQNK
jgi:integrase